MIIAEDKEQWEIKNLNTKEILSDMKIRWNIYFWIDLKHTQKLWRKTPNKEKHIRKQYLRKILYGKEIATINTNKKSKPLNLNNVITRTIRKPQTP